MIVFEKIASYLRRGLASSHLRYVEFRNYIVGKIDRRKRYYAEFFTDRYLRKTFFPDFSYRGCMVEVGCATPELLSMSQHFRDCGWRCVGVEPNPRFVALHRARNNEVYQFAAADFEADDHDFVVVEASAEYSDHQISAHSFSSLSIKPEYAGYKGGVVSQAKQTHIKVQVRRLDDILEVNCPEVLSIDILTVDVEGYELEVMKGFTPSRFQTKVIVLENLFHSETYTEYMRGVGYRLHSKIKYNYIYVVDGMCVVDGENPGRVTAPDER